MALTNTTPYDTVVNQWLANSNWYGNSTKAALRKEAIDWLIVNRPSYSAGDDSVTINYKEIMAESKRLSEFLQSANTSRVSFTKGLMLFP